MTLDDLKHAQRERIIYLDRCFTWRGVANRRNLIERFGISTAQAALDFRVYLDLTGDAPPAYDNTGKIYIASATHVPLVSSTPLEAFEVLAEQGGNGPPAMLVPLPGRMDPRVVCRLHGAIRAGSALRVRYTSISSGSDEVQWIAPTRFTSDNETVHLRAYSFRHEEYRFYLPIRIDPESGFEHRPLNAPLPHDTDWHTRTIIRLRPRSDLTPAQAAIVRREYGFDGEFLTIETRKALTFFITRRWGLGESGSRLEQVSLD